MNRLTACTTIADTLTVARWLIGQGWDPTHLGGDLLRCPISPRDADAYHWSVSGAVHRATKFPQVAMPTLALLRSTLRDAGFPPSVVLFEETARTCRKGSKMLDGLLLAAILRQASSRPTGRST